MKQPHFRAIFAAAIAAVAASATLPGMRYAWIVFLCLPSLYGGISERPGRSFCVFMPIVQHIIS